MVPEELVERGAAAIAQSTNYSRELARAVLEAVYTSPKAVGWYCPECVSVSRDPGRHYTRCSKPAVVPVFIEIPGAESNA